MQDTTTTINDLKQTIKKFIEEREWQQYHSPKNLSMQIAAEAAELMELLLWVECPNRATLSGSCSRISILREYSHGLSLVISRNGLPKRSMDCALMFAAVCRLID